MGQTQADLHIESKRPRMFDRNLTAGEFNGSEVIT